MACGYDTMTVLEMLFDMDMDMALMVIVYTATQIAIVVVVIVAHTKCAITCSLFKIRKVR